MSGIMLVVQPGGAVLTLPWPEDDLAQAVALRIAVGGGVEQLASAFHTLDHHQVFVNDDGFERLPENPRAHLLIGMDPEYAPPCGPVAIVPLPAGQDNRADRVSQGHFFGTLDAVALGLVSGTDAGIGALIDAREE